MKAESKIGRCCRLRMGNALLLPIVLAGCGGALYKVKPAVELAPMAGAVKTASAGGVTVRVAPLLSDEESQELFEANVPLAGVLPVRLALDYEGGAPIELKKARFKLRDAEGREWKVLKPKDAVSQILKANGVFLYNPHSRKQFEEDFASYAIDLATPISPANRSRHGFLFFGVPDKQPVQSPRGLVLSIDRVPQPIQLNLN